MCLMHGLIQSNRGTQPDCRAMDCDKIAYYYSEWVHSDPFDIAMTSKTAFEALGKPGVKV